MWRKSTHLVVSLQLGPRIMAVRNRVQGILTAGRSSRMKPTSFIDAKPETKGVQF
ncbi:MAG: hypothetical protein WCI46_03015 [Verrucomicrobiota bacterium]